MGPNYVAALIKIVEKRGYYLESEVKALRELHANGCSAEQAARIVAEAIVKHDDVLLCARRYIMAFEILKRMEGKKS